VAVPVVGDARHEDNEGLVMSLSGVGSASPPISTATAAGTIIDDDPPGASPPAAAAASPLPASPPPAAPLPPLRAADLLKFPSTKTCASRRRFSIRLRIPKGLAVRRAVVKVNGKQVQVVKGSRLRAPVDLRSFVKGRFTVTITVSAVDGRKVTGTRRYRTCTKKRKGGRIRV
jgi:hypothetical protein